MGEVTNSRGETMGISQQINTPDGIERALGSKGRIAIVGLSPKAERDSNKVARYLLDNGFEIVPVNPMVDEVLGCKSYPSVSAIVGDVEIVDIFRRPDDVPPIIDEAVRKGARTVWMQLGVVNEDAARSALESGLDVIMDKCIKIEHQKRNVIG